MFRSNHPYLLAALAALVPYAVLLAQSTTPGQELAAPIPPGAIYAAPDGVENSAGTENAPTTVQQALKSAPAGATIVLRGGSYRAARVEVLKRVTIGAYPGEKPVFKGSSIVSDWVRDGDKWRRDGWKSQFPFKGDKRNIDAQFPLAGNGDMAFIDGRALRQVGSLEEVKTGTFFVDYETQQLWIGDDPTGKLVEATDKEKGFLIRKTPSADPSGSVVRGLTFEHYAQNGMDTGAARLTLENNVFQRNGRRGLWIYGTIGGVTGNVSEDLILRGNSFLDNGHTGFDGDRLHRIVVEDNIVARNNAERFKTNWAAAGFKILHTEGATIRRNTVQDNNAHGIWLDISCVGAKITRNTVRGNRLGIFLELSHDSLIAFNVCHDNASGIKIGDSSRIRVWNNTLVRNTRHLDIDDTARVNDETNPETAGDVYNKPLAGVVTWKTRENSLVNNLLSDGKSESGALVSTKPHEATSASMLSALDFNAYHRSAPNAPKTAVVWRDAAQKAVEYATIREFAAATGFEKNALVLDDRPANTLFVDAAQNDFRLQAGSAALGRGETLPADIAAAAQVKSDAPTFLGALPVAAP